MSLKADPRSLRILSSYAWEEYLYGKLTSASQKASPVRRNPTRKVEFVWKIDTGFRKSFYENSLIKGLLCLGILDKIDSDSLTSIDLSRIRRREKSLHPVQDFDEIGYNTSTGHRVWLFELTELGNCHGDCK